MQQIPASVALASGSVQHTDSSGAGSVTQRICTDTNDAHLLAVAPPRRALHMHKY